LVLAVEKGVAAEMLQMVNEELVEATIKQRLESVPYFRLDRELKGRREDQNGRPPSGDPPLMRLRFGWSRMF
jgi:hypothetical protein